MSKPSRNLTLKLSCDKVPKIVMTCHEVDYMMHRKESSQRYNYWLT